MEKLAGGLRRYEDAIRKPERLFVRAVKKDPPAMPEDLIKAFKNKGEAYAYFQSLSPSYRNMCISWINSANKDEI